MIDDELLNEVVSLVEAPTAFRGEIDRKDLSLPRQVLTSVMKKHQRYFPIESEGALLPYFVGVRNGGDQHIDMVIEATGKPDVGAEVAATALMHGKHVGMLNVETDATAGYYLNSLAREKGLVYTVCAGDEPAAVKELSSV